MENIGIGTRVKHPTYGQGIICQIGLTAFMISFYEGGLREIDRSEPMDVMEVVEAANNMITFDEMEDALLRILERHSDVAPVIPLGDRWKGGTMVLEPKDTSLAVKEIPIETFFHKIVMMRDRLRVLEQNINSHKSLSDEEKVNIQQYITRCYGTMTSFNILFRDKEDHFKGESKS